jgi:hypothetical protein
MTPSLLHITLEYNSITTSLIHNYYIITTSLLHCALLRITAALPLNYFTITTVASGLTTYYGLLLYAMTSPLLLITTKCHYFIM